MNFVATIPPLGNLDAYIAAVMKYPMLTLEEEMEYGRRQRDSSDAQAAARLVLSHLKLVVSMSRQYLGYGLPHADLIQEGNIGLMKAVKAFDPDRGIRLANYAMHWIRATVTEYIIRNWRTVRIATTKPQRKLFFGLRSLKNKLQGEEFVDGPLTDSQIDHIAKELNVKPEEVIEMEMRFGGGDVTFDLDEESDETFSFAKHLGDCTHEPTAVIENHQFDAVSTEGVRLAMEELNERERRIIEARWITVSETGVGTPLRELAEEFGVSMERIRQIEVGAMKKMKKILQEYAGVL